MFYLEKERNTAIQAVLEATKICQLIRSELVSDETVQKKDRSPVTIADFCSQIAITLRLRGAFPDDPLVAEETSADFEKLGDQQIKNRVRELVQTLDSSIDHTGLLTALDRGGFPGGADCRFWTLDPIDGTKGFLRGEQYAVSLGLIENGRVVLGVLGCPNYPVDWNRPSEAAGHLFVAVDGQGATMISIETGEERPIRVSDIDDASQTVFCESVESGHSSHGDSEKIAEALGVIHPPLRIDSQCKYAAVARGDASIYLRLPTRADYVEKIWDHAAGWIILREAGGTVSDIHGQPIDFSLGRALRANQGIVASVPGIHERVMDAVQSVLCM